MPQHAIVDTALVQQWIASNAELKAVEEQLQQKGFDKELIAAHISEYKRARYSKRMFNGFICAGLGAFLGFVSCVLTIINPVPELYNIILFGLTSVAILLICLGLYFLFE
jgi:hypothetical protein